MFIATDGFNDIVYNAGANAYLIVPVPAAPTDVTAVQSGDQFQVAWTPNGVNPVAITSSTLTATPVNSTNSVLTTTVTGPGTNGVILSLQPATEYQITAVSTTIGGSGPASIPTNVTTEVSLDCAIGPDQRHGAVGRTPTARSRTTRSSPPGRRPRPATARLINIRSRSPATATPRPPLPRPRRRCPERR